MTNSVAARLFEHHYTFDFFQAMRLLERLYPTRKVIGRAGPPGAEVVRLQAHLSFSFPPSSIFDLNRSPEGLPMPLMTVPFFGLYGPSGVLPRHYTELLIFLDKEAREEKEGQRNALRAWLDLFNHRLISLFYRAWEKYRFYVPYERGEYARTDPDLYTSCLYSFVGMGLPQLRNRLRVSVRDQADEENPERVLARVDDLALLHYSGFLSHRPRCVQSLEVLLQDYFQLPAQVEQFWGQWLQLAANNQSRMGCLDENNQLGLNVIAGERVWDFESKIRVRLGPMGYRSFTEFLPDRSPVSQRKAFFLLVHLVRLYVGSELDFDVQLILKAADVPACQLTEGDGLGPRLGWNTWMCSQTLSHDAEDAVFDGEEVVWL